MKSYEVNKVCHGNSCDFFHDFKAFDFSGEISYENRGRLVSSGYAYRYTVATSAVSHNLSEQRFFAAGQTSDGAPHANTAASSTTRTHERTRSNNTHTTNVRTVRSIAGPLKAVRRGGGCAPRVGQATAGSHNKAARRSHAA